MAEKTSFRDLLASSTPEDSITLDLVDEQIAVITLNRPLARNAINRDLTARLSETVRIVEQDDSVILALVCGAGDAFCAGADLKEVLAGHLDRLFTEDGGLGGFTHASRSKPWIACVEGAALAGGFEIALSCDLLVASETAFFGLPEVRRGLMASAGGIYRLPRSIPRALALELIATGAPLRASAAHALGLVNRIVPPGKALEAGLELARAISANAPLAVRESLAVARAAFDGSDRSLYEMGDEAQNRLKQTLDFVEGSQAFIEKRPPRWRGR